MNPPIDPTLIDRLVDGELDPALRRDLLLGLDATPDGWRRCALAFLEAQEFGHAARSWARDHAGPAARPPAHRPGAPHTRLAMAATVAAVAFFGGFSARGWAESSEGTRPERPVAETGPARAPSVVERSQAEPTRSDSPEVEGSPPTMPDYVRVQWARLGYQVEPTKKLISVEEDGRRVTVPLQGYRVEYVGRPTY